MRIHFKLIAMCLMGISIVWLIFFIYLFYQSQSRLDQSFPASIEKDLEKDLEKDTSLKKDFDNIHLDYIPIHEEGAGVLSVQKSNEVVARVRALLRGYAFEEASDYITSTLKRYELESNPEHNELKIIYQDMPILVAFEKMAKENEAMAMVEGLKQGWVQDEENFLLSVLRLPHAMRGFFYLSRTAISPVDASRIEIIAKEALSEEAYNPYEYLLNKGIVGATKISFKLKNNNVWVVIVKDKDKQLWIADFQKGEDCEASYRTLEEWQAIQND